MATDAPKVDTGAAAPPAPTEGAVRAPVERSSSGGPSHRELVGGHPAQTEARAETVTGQAAAGTRPASEATAALAGDPAAGSKPRVEGQEASTSATPDAAPASPQTAETRPAGVNGGAQPETTQGQRSSGAAQESSPSPAIKTPSVAEMQTRLRTEGIKIGEVTFRMREGQTPAQVFAEGIKSLVGQVGEHGATQLQQEYLQFAVETAVASGVSRGQLRVELDGYYPQPRIIDQDTKEVIDQGNPGLDPKLRGVLGLPEVKPTKPESPTESERAAAQKERREILGKIIKANREQGQNAKPIDEILPAEDIKRAAEDTVEMRFAQIFPHPNRGQSKRAQEIIGLIPHLSADDQARIIANPDAFIRDEKNLTVADMVKRRVKYTKGWRQLGDVGQKQMSAREQFLALMANAEQLKKIKREYRTKQPILAIILKLVLYVLGTTMYETLSSQIVSFGEGKVQG